MKKSIAMLAFAACLPLSGAVFAQMPEITATFTDTVWDGETIPAGQNCKSTATAPSGSNAKVSVHGPLTWTV